MSKNSKQKSKSNKNFPDGSARVAEPIVMYEHNPNKDPRAVARINQNALSYFEMQGYCPYTKVSQVEGLVARLGKEKEFCLCPLFAPDVINEGCKQGFFPMAISLGQGVFILATKIHVERSLTFLPEFVAKGSSNRKHSKRYKMLINDPATIDPLYRMIWREHGDNWLCSELRQCFYYMFCHSEDFDAKLHVFAIVEEEGDEEEGEEKVSESSPSPSNSSGSPAGGSPLFKKGESIPIPGTSLQLVAGEFGYTVADIYTSLTGAFVKGGTGTVQLLALGQLLQSCGYKYWDLGMGMDYKTEMLQCKAIPRASWVEKVKERRKTSKQATKEILQSIATSIEGDTKRKEKGKEQKGEEKMMGDRILGGHVMNQPSDKPFTDDYLAIRQSLSASDTYINLHHLPAGLKKVNCRDFYPSLSPPATKTSPSSQKKQEVADGTFETPKEKIIKSADNGKQTSEAKSKEQEKEGCKNEEKGKMKPEVCEEIRQAQLRKKEENKKRKAGGETSEEKNSITSPEAKTPPTTASLPSSLVTPKDGKNFKGREAATAFSPFEQKLFSSILLDGGEMLDTSPLVIDVQKTSPATTQGQGVATSVDPMKANLLIGMGFSKAAVEQALIDGQGDFQAALAALRKK